METGTGLLAGRRGIDGRGGTGGNRAILPSFLLDGILSVRINSGDDAGIFWDVNWMATGEGADLRIVGTGIDLSVKEELTLRDDGLEDLEGAVVLAVRKSGTEDVDIFREGGGGGGVFRFEGSAVALVKLSFLLTAGRFAKGGTGGALDMTAVASAVLAIFEVEEDAEIDCFGGK